MKNNAKRTESNALSKRYHLILEKCKHVAKSAYYAGCLATHAVTTTLEQLELKKGEKRKSTKNLQISRPEERSK